MAESDIADRVPGHPGYHARDRTHPADRSDIVES